MKNAGDVEDGEYDWMKINKDSGKGWDSMKNHGAAYLHNPNARPGPSQMELHSGRHPGNTTSQPQAPITVSRLNAAQPPPPSPIKQMGSKRDRPSAQGGLQAQRMSGTGLREMGTPTGSTQAQFQNSTQNLPQPITTQPGPMAAAGQSSGRPAEAPQPSGFQKFIKTICCG